MSRLVLASTSPRRAALLREAGYAFEQIAPGYDEAAAALEHLPADLAAPALAYFKAHTAAALYPDRLVIAADTLLALGEQHIGKPRDRAHARAILTQLFGRTHRVVTAVCVAHRAEAPRHVLVDQAEVYLEPLSENQLEHYLRSECWRGKAGGYNLGQLREPWRFTVAGDPTTVIGLPMRRLVPLLQQIAPDLERACEPTP